MTLPNLVDLESLVLAAFRTEIGQVVKATTGASVGMAATATGYARTDGGSFLDDNFDVGDELTVAGYASAGNNGMKWVEFVDATTLTVRSLTTMVIEAAGPSVTITSSVPETWKMDGMAVDNPLPDPRRPWLSESYQPNDTRAASIGGATSGRPMMRMNGFYWLTIHYPIGVGTGGILRLRGKISQRIYPGRSLLYMGHTIRVQRASPKGTIEKGEFTSGALAIGFQADALNPS